jgi:16S rRNA (uracil1498-N3)-methyltransferase
MREGSPPGPNRSWRRFFVSPEAISGETFVISGSDAKHIATVLRMSARDHLTLLTGDGRECLGVITTVSRTDVTGRIVSTAPASGEPGVRIELIQCLPKGDKMDLVVRKCVEIGVSRVVPAISQRSVARPRQDQAERKAARWRRIAEEASKQCGRSAIPEVASLTTFAEAVTGPSDDWLKLIPFELESERSLKSELSDTRSKKIALCIGPEGGFSKEEVDLAVSHGFIPVTLGRRILRTETTGLVVAACILYHMDELG